MKIGLLPLYIKLYDDFARHIYRERLDAFYEKVVNRFKEYDIDVVTSEFCRVKEEFDIAVKTFEDADVDCIVTLHMAYSPSLESIDALANTALPLVVLDITETYDFSDNQISKEISFCHGIHGVMDMCNLLKRSKKEYAIAAGHFDNSDVFEKCIGFVKAAKAANALKDSRVGTIGGSFDGMGDFIVTDDELKNAFDTDVVYGDITEISNLADNISQTEIEKEIESYKNDYEIISEVSDEALYNTAKNCLVVRKWIQNNKLSAFTVNFRKIGDEAGINVMPFIEAGKQMAKGIGYAGEGDVLTAAVVGALMQGFSNTGFIEIFCPDWKNNALFISHMGEMNFNLCDKKPEMKEINFLYGQNAKKPVVAYGCYKSGNAVYVNIFRDANGFCLLCAPVTVEAETTDNFKGSIRGWIKPKYELPEFLEKISYAGVTHHSALIYDATVEELKYFGRLLNLNVMEL